MHMIVRVCDFAALIVDFLIFLPVADKCMLFSCALLAVTVISFCCCLFEYYSDLPEYCCNKIQKLWHWKL